MISERPDEFAGLLSGLIEGRRADEEAFFQLAWKKLMTWSGLRFLIAEKDREDFAVEVIEKALVRISRYQVSKGNFSAWLFAVARNHAIDRARRLYAGRDVLHDTLTEEALDWERQPPAASPEESGVNIDHGGLRSALDAALAGLPADDQELLQLTYSGISAVRIAEICQLTPANVRQRHHRLLKKLSALLNQPC